MSCSTTRSETKLCVSLVKGKKEDDLIGLCDATDSRYSDDTSLQGEDPHAVARFIQFETLPKD